MTTLDDADADTLLSGTADWIDSDVAGRLARHPIDCLDTEYPHYVGSLDGPDDHVPPSEQHPVFFGCFDWHSAVHSHWGLVRGLRLFEDHPDETAITEAIDARLTDENVAREVEYVEANPGFEKPYGWGWLLRLAAELRLWDDPRANAWQETLEPLEATIADLVASEFLPVERAFRVGTHGNTAFALACVLDYARVAGRGDLAEAAAASARDCYLDDVNYPVAYEPLGWDFVSPALTEADLMRRVLDGDRFGAWLDAFLPDVTAAPHETILDPVDVEPASADGVELHLVGLDVAKAWCLAGLADALDGHRYEKPFRESAARHATYGLDRAFTDDYAGSHWLSSFVLYLLTRNEGGIAPA